MINTYYQLIDALKKEASKEPNCNLQLYPDIYELLKLTLRHVPRDEEGNLDIEGIPTLEKIAADDLAEKKAKQEKRNYRCQ